MFQVGAAAWPGLALSETAFALHVRRLGDDCLAMESRRYAVDLFLACACALGVAGALAEFDKTMGPEIDATIHRFATDPDIRDELGRQVRSLLFSHPREPGISKYSGVGPLVYWVRLLALRTARTFHRGGKGEATLCEEGAHFCAVGARDREGTAMKAELVPVFEASFARAFRALESRERTLLRFYVVDALSVDELSRLLGVHRATAARRVAAAREKLVALTRADLGESAKLTPEERDSLFRLLESQIDMSVSRIFGQDQSGRTHDGSRADRPVAPRHEVDV